jgi:hypothetical protein
VLAYNDLLSWSEYVKLWTKTTGTKAEFEHATVEDQDILAKGGYGEEMGEMYGYMVDFGYDGGDPSIVHAIDVSDLEDSPEDLKAVLIFPFQLGVNLGPITTIESYIRAEDWSQLLTNE